MRELKRHKKYKIWYISVFAASKNYFILTYLPRPKPCTVDEVFALDRSARRLHPADAAVLRQHRRHRTVLHHAHACPITIARECTRLVWAQKYICTLYVLALRLLSSNVQLPRRVACQLYVNKHLLLLKPTVQLAKKYMILI